MTVRALWRLGAWAGVALLLAPLGLPLAAVFLLGRALILAWDTWAVAALVVSSGLSAAWSAVA